MLYMVYLHTPGGLTYRRGRAFKSQHKAVRYAKGLGGKSYVESYHGQHGRSIVWANFDPANNSRQTPREFSGARFA